MASPNPYKAQPKKAFWRPAVADVHFSEMSEMSLPLDIQPSDKIATAGSCFAQHIGRALRERGANYLDLEPAPAYLSKNESSEHGFGIYSCRYGNIYTVRQLRQLAEEATGLFKPSEPVWKLGDRFCDALRPSVDPVGHASPDLVMQLRKKHLVAVRALFAQLDVFVFTLGLTETWASQLDGTVFPTCPGTIAGEFDEKKYVFQNFTYPEIIEDFKAFREILLSLNPKAKILLTVSPVTLTATASNKHVLVATTYSKSTLRAVAGDLATAFDNVMYFPSFEIITTHANHCAFFNPDLRTVNMFGVRHVMDHFFQAVSFPAQSSHGSGPKETQAIICDEEKLEKFA